MINLPLLLLPKSPPLNLLVQLNDNLLLYLACLILL